MHIPEQVYGSIGLFALPFYRGLSFSGYEATLTRIYEKTNTAHTKQILTYLKQHYAQDSNECGRNVIRYLLIHLRGETLKQVMPDYYHRDLLCEDLYLSRRCFPFEKNPFISNLVGKRTSDGGYLRQLAAAAGAEKLEAARPYLNLRNAVDRTGEIYFAADSLVTETEIHQYNDRLDAWERMQGHSIIRQNGLDWIDVYEKTTLSILRDLLHFARDGNKGQKEFNQKFIDSGSINFTDPQKKEAIKYAFVNSHLLMIYGAAGTGKTTLIDYIAGLMAGQRKLFLTKTHTALQNLKLVIKNVGSDVYFSTINSFTRKRDVNEYDVVFVDECSTIDNRMMKAFLQKLQPSTFLVLAGDIYQIESIDFGNWFYYAKDIIKTQGSNIELSNTWRTQEESLIGLWKEVRDRSSLITAKLAMDGPFSADIGASMLKREAEDEVILCLNYDGKFGLNNINNYFQNANGRSVAFTWQEWSYKIGDPILFNETEQFPLLYNNLKGRIIDIKKDAESICFTIDIDTLLTEKDCIKSNLEFVNIVEGRTRIKMTVYAYDEEEPEELNSLREKSVVPFQLAYAVSIHKAQGLEYDSVKVIIPSSNAEKITHGVFYTAITRARKKLKIFWSAETMKQIISSFTTEEEKQKSLDIVKSKLTGSTGIPL